MNYLALPLGVIIFYLISKKVLEKEKVNYLKSLKIISGVLCVLILVFIFLIQEYRKENYNFWFGVLPNFLAAVGFPFTLVLMNKNIKIFFINKFLSWSLLTFIFFTIYECILWIEGRNFDSFDILFTLIGAIISGLVITRLVTEPINDRKSKTDKH